MPADGTSAALGANGLRQSELYGATLGRANTPVSVEMLRRHKSEVKWLSSTARPRLMKLLSRALCNTLGVFRRPRHSICVRLFCSKLGSEKQCLPLIYVRNAIE
jgi:hypothetical protein